MTKFCKDCNFYIPMSRWNDEHEKAACSNPKYQDQPNISPVTGVNMTPFPRCYLMRADGLKCGTQGVGFESRSTSYAQDQANSALEAIDHQLLMDRLIKPEAIKPTKSGWFW